MIVKLYKSRTLGTDPIASRLLSQLHAGGYRTIKAIRLEQVLRAEGDISDIDALKRLFHHPLLETVGQRSRLNSKKPIVEVTYQRSMTDPELDSIMHAAASMGICGLVWVRLSTRYEFTGIGRKEASKLAAQFFYNPLVQTLLIPGKEWTTLVPQGEPGGVEQIDLALMSLRQLRKFSDDRLLHMPSEQLLAVQKFFIREGRPSRDAEVEMIAAKWSDHCYHTTWKRLGLLEYLRKTTEKINHPLVVSAYVDNSGVMRFYDGWALNSKGETHIFPTFGVDPYCGIMTKHGGVIRDIISTGQGAWPWGGTTVMATCDPRIARSRVPKGAFHPQFVLHESIRGTHDYTNPMGIPMMWSQYLVHPDNWKGLALGHSFGILPENKAKKGVPLPGDFVVLIGGPTGNDGIHGATSSSGNMTAKTRTADAASVQIGMPIEERKIMEATPLLRGADCIRACQDCGAAGLASAVGELGEACGVWLNLAWVPLKCAGLKDYQIFLSESQERCILVIPREKLPLALEILADYEVRAAVIGIFTDTRRCQVVNSPEMNQGLWSSHPTAQMSGTIAVDLPYSFLNSSCPLPKIKTRKPAVQLKRFQPRVPQTESQWVRLVCEHLAHYNICDQSEAAHRYDQTVQGNTVRTYIGGADDRMPDDLSVVTPLRGHSHGAGTANAVNQFYGEISPSVQGRLVAAQAFAKLVAAGFGPDDITLCANVYSPRATDSPENAWRLKALVKRGYGPASAILGAPVITGKDSSSGTFITKNGRRIDAPLTLDINALGRMPEVGRLIPKPFRKPGDTIVLYHPGLRKLRLGGSVFYDLFHERGSELSQLDLRQLRLGLERYHRLTEAIKCIRSQSVVCEGGLIRRLFEKGFGSGLGCSVRLPGDSLQWLFGEPGAAVLFTTDLQTFTYFEANDLHVLGQVTAEPAIEVFASNQKRLFKASLEEFSCGWSKTFAEVVQ
jgi:phosphoribosylformylglycinamidine (FGAM) synthase-like enzyme/phosphoribosylformylglycinamidine (FGAM) synthase PurS component